ncbi:MULTISPECIES: twin-arginine translocase TatA/TatE family subunit [unclassified Streptomyces]|uniref:twin-arginine translocase TatA/TatE family subunit n=1 Tax=unclassified Streptomyces TaxID=2593676 RepID=UPI003BB532A8
MFGLSELAIVLIVIAVVIGVKKLPELTRSAGKSARILKAEARAMKEQDDEHQPPPRVIQGETVTPPPREPGQESPKP